MLLLLINGKAAVLPENFKILLERYAPLMDFDFIQGARVLNFTLPFCDQNNVLFDYFGNSHISYRYNEYACELIYKGRSVQRGYLRLTDASAAGFEVIFTENFPNLFGEWDDSYLTELPFADFAMPDPLNAAAVAGVDAFCFPMIKNDDFYGTSPGSYTGILNEYESSAYLTGPKVPFFFLGWVFEEITRITGVAFTGDFFDNADMASLVLYNTRSLDDLTEIVSAGHLPKLTIRGLIKELRKLVNLAVWPNVWKKEIRIDFAAVIAPILKASRALAMISS